MSLPGMANGDEKAGVAAAWQVQDGSDASNASDRKMSSFEMFLDSHSHQGHGEGLNNNKKSSGAANGTDPGFSIVTTASDADRLKPENFLTNFPSSDQIGRLLTDEHSTDVTRNRSRADTTSALGSSSHQHHLLNYSSSHYGHQQPTFSPHSFNIYNSNSSSSNNNITNQASELTSDNHSGRLGVTASDLTYNAPTFIPSGDRDGARTARLNSGIDLDPSQASPPSTRTHHISPSSTPLQSNLSNKHSSSNTPPTAPSPPCQLLPQAATTFSIQGPSSMGHNTISDTSWTLEGKMDGRSAEGKNRDGDDSTVQSTAVFSIGTHDGVGDMLSPTSSPRVAPIAAPAHDSEGQTGVIGTPSTVSTAPSTEDASLGTDSIDKIGLKLDPSHIEPFSLHRRAPSWDRSPNALNLYDSGMNQRAEAAQQWLPQGPSQAFAHHQQRQQPHHGGAWGAQSRVATFRPEDANKHDSRGVNLYGPGQQQRGQQHQQQQMGERWHQPNRHFGTEGPYPGQQGGRIQMQELPHGYRNNQIYNSYGGVAVQRKSGYPPQHPMPPSASPQRGRGAPRSTGPSPHRAQQHSAGPATGLPTAGSSARSSSEILKTLLRKKACLYEPDTSRAVALVTWLVGRELALEHGYFSRQQLQAGVHACVAEKIESGTITRTKVNRCMQIILNSCFHYIIPRPDGTEEKGHTFRAIFEKEVSDDTSLLRLLPAPWNDLVVNRETVLQASLAEADTKPEPRSNEASPKSSPTLRPVQQPNSPDRERRGGDHNDEDSKRAVLLCFNENVRTAEDVFRCHNEFIRDSAHSSNLQLTAQEWRIFFGKEAASTPHIWGNVGIPVVAVESPDGSGRKVDVLGQMTPEEAGKFRTTWCAKRYDHDHEFCGMAHNEVNGGWLRRDPNVHFYKDEFCPSIVKMTDKRGGNSFCIVNECAEGVNCKFAHSHEEMIYHPNRYKSKACTPILRTGVCRFGDICPNHHPSDSARVTGKKGDGRPPGARHGRTTGQSGPVGKNIATMPTASPILYASPAPVSSFERHLLMPGLQNLFRRQCTVVRAYLRNPKCRCCYSHFGDDAGIDVEAPAEAPSRPGLPSLRM